MRADASRRMVQRPQLFEREQERMFAANWNDVERVEQVAQVGDLLTCRAGQVPVVIVREEAGTLRAYANVSRC
jgi:phenylpropionate dioxygenase-like ring-hydroxylating dioxygenase large terminal subunit